jgi:hypothetical protein
MPPVVATTMCEHRERLLAHDAGTIELALHLLRVGDRDRDWYIFEGPTYPDAFIETRDALVVIEGKRTEAGATTSTTWLSGRHQIWRHMDAAWEIRGSRAVYGLFLVEGDPSSPLEISEVWRKAAAATLSAAALDASFPHRAAAEREGIVRGFVGVATWQRVCHEFGLDQRLFAETVASVDA